MKMLCETYDWIKQGYRSKPFAWSRQQGSCPWVDHTTTTQRRRVKIEKSIFCSSKQFFPWKWCEAAELNLKNNLSMRNMPILCGYTRMFRSKPHLRRRDRGVAIKDASKYLDFWTYRVRNTAKIRRPWYSDHPALWPSEQVWTCCGRKPLSDRCLIRV